MEEELKTQPSADQVTDVNESGEETKQDNEIEKVLAAHRRSSKEAKDRKLKIRELETKLMDMQQNLEEHEHKKLEETSQYKALYESQKVKTKVALDESNAKLAKLLNQNLVSKVQKKGAEMGCVNTQALSRVVDLNSIIVDQNELTIDEESLDAALESVKTTVPELFLKVAPSIKDSTPAKGEVSNKNSKEEKLKSLSALFGADL